MLDQITIFGIISFINFLTCVFIGSFLLVKNLKNPINITYCIFDFCIAFYAFFYFLWQSSSDISWGILFFKWCILGVVLINSAFVHFTYVILRLAKKHTIQLILIHVLNSFFCYAALFLFYSDWVVKFTYGLWPIPSVAFHFYISWWFLQVIYCFYLIYTQGVRKTEGKPKKQYQWIFWATFIAYAGGATNWLVWYGINFPPYLNSGIAIYTLVLAYAIFRHQLLDIEIIIRKTLVFAGTLVLFLFLFVTLTYFANLIIANNVGISANVATLLTLALVVLIYEPVRDALVNLTDKFLFQKKFRLTSIVAQASQAISLVESLKWLSRRIIAFLVTTCRIKNAVIYVSNRHEDLFTRGALRGYAPHERPQFSIPGHNPIIQYLKRTRKPLELHRLEEMSSATDALPFSAKECEEMKQIFKELKAELVIPSFLRRRIETTGLGRERSGQEEVELRNVLVLGGKKSDEPYSEEELDVFSSLAQESAIAIENARLYDEAVQRSRELANMNKELEDANKRLQVTQASLIVAEKNATMVNMAKAIGHEVNNPLSVVKLKTQRLLARSMKKGFDLLNQASSEQPIEPAMKELLQTVEEDLRKISSASSRIDGVIQTLTGILRESSGEMEALSLLLLLQEAKEATRFSTYEENLSGCEIKLNIDANQMVLGDARRLLQVFINLFKNAYEAMEEAGTQHRQIIVQGRLDPDDSAFVRIDVKDNGPGIPPHIIEKIWQQDFSTKVKRHDDIGAVGQGQGLFICKHMIESVHKGSIVAESEVGKGTTFIIRLPKAEME